MLGNQNALLPPLRIRLIRPGNVSRLNFAARSIMNPWSSTNTKHHKTNMSVTVRGVHPLTVKTSQTVSSPGAVHT